MRVKAFIGLLALWLGSIAAVPLFAAGTTGTTGAAFLELGIGSRPQGMGQAFTAETGDVNLLYYNPAGLGTLRYPVLSLQHQELLLDSRLENVSIAYPLLGGYIAASNSIFWVPTFDQINEDGLSTGDVSYYNGALTVGYGYNLGFMYLGGSMKYIYQHIGPKTYHGFAMDIGILKGLRLFTPFEAPTQNLHIGLSILNLGPDIVGEFPLPRTIRLGASYKLTNWFGLNLDLVENIIDFSDLYDFTYGFNESFRLNAGIEFSYLDILSIRAGYRFNDVSTSTFSYYTLGLGFNYVVGNVTFTIDATYADAGQFDPSYSFNITFKLIPKVVTLQDRMDAEGHYRRGIRNYVAGDVDTALTEFRTTRDINPYHKNIGKRIDDLEELQRLIKENKKMEEKGANEEVQELERNPQTENND
jgi:hypothetical protein